MGTEQRSNQAWLVEELQDVSLGDERLDWRLLDTGSKLAAQPGASINQACDDWADTKASYRLFENQKTEAAKILAPHYRRTGERAASHARVFAIQDTSFLDYTHHPAKDGLGPIGTTQQDLRGLVMHSVLLMTEAGTPLGLIDQAIWARPEAAKQMSADQRRRLPIEDKESHKWLQGLEQTVVRVPAGPQLITVGDREADIFEVFNRARTRQTDLLVRAGQNRCVCEPEIGHLWDLVAAQAEAGQLSVAVPPRPKEPQRQAIVTVRFARVTLKTPQHLRHQMADITLHAVLVREEDPPAHVKQPLCWLLLTTVPVYTFAEAVERVRWYRLRWRIEVYHKVLKSGCRVEQTQLSSVDRLLPYLALFGIIAWRLFWLTQVARHHPDAPCTRVLAEHEWQALYTFHHKTDCLPPTPPTVAQVVRWIAQLGGFLARKNDGHPGVTVIWRGWHRLMDIASAWLLFHPQPDVGNG